MRSTPLLQRAVLWLALLPLAGHAACLQNNPEALVNYDGTLGDGLRVRMTLVFAGTQVRGLYFYASQLKDIALTGQVTDGSGIVLDELDAQGQAVARFEGRFAEQDPQGRFRGNALQCEIIVGNWHALGADTTLPVYLSMESSTIGSLTQRYEPAGAPDDALVHRRAQAFRDAVLRGDKAGVAKLVAYPVHVQLPSGPKRLRTPAELIANYDVIFFPRFRDAIAKALPRNMFVRDQGIMLGSGEVWFGPDGKVIALNNR